MTLLQQWVQFAYYAKQVIELLEGKTDLSPWLINAIEFHHGDGATPQEAAEAILAHPY